jgi:cell division protein FtsL
MMIIDTKTIVLTLLIVVIACTCGLRFVRAFALQIAQENHDAVLAMDQADEEKRRRKERDADMAAASAYAKVQPILTEPTSSVPPGSVHTPEVASPHGSQV